MQPTTRSGGNATGSSAGSLSRRSTLRGSAAAAILLAAGVTAAQPATAAPDDALIDLARQIETLTVREREAWDRRADVEEAVSMASPPVPVCRKVADPFDAGDSMSPLERLALYSGPNRYCNDLADAEAEHRAALAEHARVVEAIEKHHGLPRLERQASRLTDQVTAASERLAEMRATTSPGLAAKARVLLVVGGDPLSRSAEFERHAALLESLLEDAARFGTEALA